MTRSMMYLYAITEPSEIPPPSGVGFENAPLCRIGYQEIAATVSPIMTSQVEATEAHLWQHEAVIEGIMSYCTVLPVRFGTVLADEDAVHAVLIAHYADFKANLERLRNRVEVGLRVLWNPPALLLTGSRRVDREDGGLSVAKSGRAYLLARLEKEQQMQHWRQQAETLADTLHTPLARLAVDCTRRILITPHILLTSAYLVELKDITAFQRLVQDLDRFHPELRCLCTGPWPAYSFVTGVRCWFSGHRKVCNTL